MDLQKLIACTQDETLGEAYLAMLSGKYASEKQAAGSLNIANKYDRGDRKTVSVEIFKPGQIDTAKPTAYNRKDKTIIQNGELAALRDRLPEKMRVWFDAYLAGDKLGPTTSHYNRLHKLIKACKKLVKESE